MTVLAYPGHTSDMTGPPHDEMRHYVGRGLLADCRALITGGDSGIGRAVPIDSYFIVTKAGLQHIPDGGAVINTASVNGPRGNKALIDYPAIKGAVLAFTYALAQYLADRNIQVNCVAPGEVLAPPGGETHPG